jgi:hypothetical protein
MPNVAGREFPYTPQGMASADRYRQSLGMRHGGTMGFRPVGYQEGGGVESDTEIPLDDVARAFVDLVSSGASVLEIRRFINENRAALEGRAAAGPGIIRRLLNLYEEGTSTPQDEQQEAIDAEGIRGPDSPRFDYLEPEEYDPGLMPLREPGTGIPQKIYRPELGDDVRQILPPGLKEELPEFQEEMIPPGFGERFAPKPRHRFGPETWPEQGYPSRADDLWGIGAGRLEEQRGGLTGSVAPEMEGNIPRFKPPWMSDPRYKGYFNPNQLNPFFNPHDIKVAGGGYVGRDMRNGGMMGFRPIGYAHGDLVEDGGNLGRIQGSGAAGFAGLPEDVGNLGRIQGSGAAGAGVASDVMAIFQGLVDVTRSGSVQDVAAYIEANRQDLNDMVSMMMLPPGQADFVRNTLSSFPSLTQPQMPLQMPPQPMPPPLTQPQMPPQMPPQPMPLMPPQGIPRPSDRGPAGIYRESGRFEDIPGVDRETGDYYPPSERRHGGVMSIRRR